MGVQEIAVEGAKKAGGIFFLPGGNISWIITGFFFIVLIIVASVHSVQEKSIYPFVKETALRLVSADSQIDQAVKDVQGNPATPKYSNWLKYVNFFDGWFWMWVFFWFTVISCLWFMYFFFMILYNVVQAFDTTSPVSATILTILLYIILVMLGNVLAYHASLAGTQLPNSESQVLLDDLGHSVPLGGVYRLVMMTWKGGLWEKVASVADTGLVGSASNIPHPLVNSSSVNGTY
jgi:hypothetical protein